MRPVDARAAIAPESQMAVAVMHIRNVRMGMRDRRMHVGM
jgi:hypothetical protein